MAVPRQIAHGLVEGELDLGFTIGAESLQGVDTHLIAESAGVLVCGREHPLFERGVVTAQDLMDYPSVVPRHWQRDYLTSLDQYPEARMPRRIGATTELMQMAVQLAIEGAYLGYFPQVTVGCPLRHDELRILVGLAPGKPFRLNALTRKGTTPRASARLVMEEVKQTVKDNGGDPCG